MNRSKKIIKKTFLVAVAAAAACMAGSASAETAPGPNGAHTPGAVATSTTLMGQNFTKGCVRFYVNGRQRDVQANKAYNFGTVAADKQFMASAFAHGCGGAAVKNVWFKTSGAQATNWWAVR